MFLFSILDSTFKLSLLTMLGKDVVPHNDWKDHCDLAPASALRITALLPQLFPEGGLLAAPSLADSDTLCQPVYVSRLD